MKKIYLSLITAFFFVTGSFAQTVIVAGAGVDPVTLAGNPYSSLNGAFTNLNGAAQTGIIIITVNGTTVEPASAVLNAGGWTSMSIIPIGASAVTGNIVGHLIDLNGADNVTIDGLNLAGNSLALNNSNGTIATTVRFVNDATNNTIINCNLLGSSGITAGPGLGIVYFALGTTTGNDNNTITQCNFSASSSGTPLNAIYSLGLSAAVDNSNNNISINNIADFHNPTASSSGINLTSFNSAWSITNNAFYQTTNPRTATTGNTYNAISITSGSGYTVSNNIIGGSNASAGGSAWALSGTVALRFIAINMGTATGTTSSVQNNTFTNFTLNTSSGASTTNGVICGINLTSTGNVNVGTVTGNNIGASAGVDNIRATPTTAGGLVVAIHSSTTGNISIQNNVIGALACSGITAAVSGSITAINISGAAANLNISNNTIGNITADNMRGGTLGLTTGSSLVSGINIPATTSPANIAIANNTIRNLSSFGTGNAGFVRGIQTGVALGCNTATVTGNTIFNLTSNNANVGVGNAQLAAQGIYYNIVPATNPDISNNTIYNISLTNTGLLATNVAGISISNATAFTLTKNRIYGLSNASTATSVTAPGTVSGIHIRGVNTPSTLANNMISLGNSQTTNTAFIGIWYQGGGSLLNALIYYNSVNIEGAVAAGAQPSFGLYRGNFSAAAILGVVDIRNNIFNNTRSGGTGAHIAIANNYGATASATGWLSGAANYNVLNAASPANVGWWTTAQTFATWKIASSGDTYSVSGIAVPFTATATADLHLGFGVTPTQIESGGIAISGIAIDYDNQLRPGPAGSINGGGTAPDIGADEIDAVPLDLFGPVITYSPLLNSTCATTRPFTATIIDNSGVNGAVGTRPRVYYKRSTDGNVWNDNTNATAGWKYAEATNASSPFNFLIDYSLLSGGGGVVVGDVVQYFVVAQDVSPAVNISINSGTFAIAPASVALTATAFPIGGTINSYTIVTGLPTSITIGAAGTYTSLTGAAGLFNAINTQGLSGNTTVNIIDASVTEAGTVALNQIQPGDCSATGYTLLIKPQAATTSILTGTTTSVLIRILSSNVTIDGSNNGTTSRDLTITNTNATSGGVVLFGSTGTIPVNNDVIKNSIIINGTTGTTALIVSDGAAPGTAGYFTNITIQNNDIRQAFVGNYNIAVPVPGNGSGLLITGNLLNTTGAASIRRIGIYMQGVDGATVTGNLIGNFEAVNGENDNGIWLASGTVNTVISANTISGLGYTGASTFAPTGINITAGVSAANLTVTGNSISGLSSGGGNTGVSTNGISLGFGTSGVSISRNTISNIKNTNALGWGAAGILLGSTSTTANCTVFNNFIFDVAGFGFAGGNADDNGNGISVNAGAGYNIYYNTVHMNTNQSLVTGLPAALLVTSGVTTAGAIDLRDNIFTNSQTVGTERYAIYSGAANTVFSNIDYNDYYTAGPNLGFIGTNRANLAAIQAGFGGNNNSLNVQPDFVSATDLHLVANTNCGLDGYGTPIVVVPTDYDVTVRDATTPDMGADEFTATYSGTLAGIAGSAVCENKTVSAAGTTYATSACNLIARVLPSGGSAVNGKINVCVTLDAAPQIFNAEPYVQRHHDIEPVVSPATATATVTLYYTDQEFVDYNSNNTVWPDLPTLAGGGMGDANRANVRVTQFHGVASTSPSTPGNYPGTRVLINPGAANVIWNGFYWAVTIPVTGFSGFYLHTTISNFPLPIMVNYLNGHKQNGNHLLDWKVTCVSTPRATMTLERSVDSRNYSGIYTITADAARCNQPFNYTDANPLNGMNYYRLKIVDADGKITYSTTVALLNAPKGFEIISIAPNPVVADNFKLNMTSANASKMDITIFDMLGRLVNRQSVSVIAGFNKLDINVANLSSGTYTIQGTIADERSKVTRFVKQ